MRGEVAAAKVAWPLVANGLPADTGAEPRGDPMRRGRDSAAQLPLPALLQEAQAASLTGPALDSSRACFAPTRA